MNKIATNPPDDTGAEKDVQEAKNAAAFVEAVRELRAAVRPIARRELRERATVAPKPAVTQVTKLVERNDEGQIVSVTERHEPVTDEGAN